MVEYEKDGIVKSYMTDYVRASLKKSTGFEAELENYAACNDVPIVQPETAKFLQTFVMANKPQKILEVGCAIGYSAILMAKAYPESHITTLEFDADIAEIAKSNIQKAGLMQRVKVVYADARDYIPYMDLDDEFDLIFLDGPKAHYINMLDDCIRLLKTGGVLLCDNILYKGMTAQDDLVIKRKITIVKRLRKLIDELTSRDDLETAILTIGDSVNKKVLGENHAKTGTAGPGREPCKIKNSYRLWSRCSVCRRRGVLS